MYGETQLERQTREAESVQTDSILAQLFPKAQQLPELTVNASTLPMFLALLAGLWFFGSTSGRRSLWILVLCLVSAATLPAQIPSGMTAWYNMNEWCGGTFAATYTNFEPSKVIVALQRARTCKIGLVVVYPRRLYTTTGGNSGPYSKAKHRAATDAYARVLPTDTLRKYVASRTLLGIVTGDDYGCAPCWSGHAIPWSEARDAANYAKQKMPAAPIGIRLDALKMSNVSGWKTDFGWAQWANGKYNLRVYRTQSNWYTLNASAAKKLGVGMFYGMNTADCYAATPHTRCPPATVKSQGTVALNWPKNCGFMAWYYQPDAYNGAYKAEWVKLLNLAKTKPFTSCKVR